MIISSSRPNYLRYFVIVWLCTHKTEHECHETQIIGFWAIAWRGYASYRRLALPILLLSRQQALLKLKYLLNGLPTRCSFHSRWKERLFCCWKQSSCPCLLDCVGFKVTGVTSVVGYQIIIGFNPFTNEELVI